MNSSALSAAAPGVSVGIDIGGTKIAVAIAESSGHLLGRTLFATEAALGFGRAVGRIGAAIDALLRQPAMAARPLRSIGIGCAGPLDSAAGLINNPYTLEGWDRCDIVTPLHERFRVPVRLENDADAAAVGEWRAGAGRGATSMAMLTLGTGVGGGIIQDGRIYRGAAGEHPELGHLVADPAGPECYCGARGCLESIASGTAIGAAGQAAGFADARAVFAAAGEGQAAAVAIVERAIAATATAIWTLCHTLLPDRVVLGGGIMDEHYARYEPVVTAALRRATQFTPAHVRVCRAQQGNEAGLVGAALLAD